MRTGFDFLGGFDGFSERFQLTQHLFDGAFIPFLFGSRSLFSHLGIKLFHFGFKDPNKIFQEFTFSFLELPVDFAHGKHLMGSMTASR